MAVRARYKIEVALSSTTAEEKDLGNQTYLVVSDSLNEAGTRKVRLAAGVVDAVVSMNQISTASLLVVRTNAVNSNDTPTTIELKRNLTTAEVMPIVPLTGTSEGHLLMSTSGITALYASNPGSIDMELTLVLAGD